MSTCLLHRWTRRTQAMDRQRDARTVDVRTAGPTSIATATAPPQPHPAQAPPRKLEPLTARPPSASSSPGGPFIAPSLSALAAAGGSGSKPIGGPSRASSTGRSLPSMARVQQDAQADGQCQGAPILASEAPDTDAHARATAFEEPATVAGHARGSDDDDMLRTAGTAASCHVRQLQQLRRSTAQPT